MIVRGHIFGTIAAGVMLVIFSSSTADAGFVTNASLEAFIPSASTSALPEGKTDYEPPAWLKHLLTITARNADGSDAGSMTGTTSTTVSTSHSALPSESVLCTSDDAGQYLSLPSCRTHVPPDLDGLSPPPRG